MGQYDGGELCVCVCMYVWVCVYACECVYVYIHRRNSGESQGANARPPVFFLRKNSFFFGNWVEDGNIKKKLRENWGKGLMCIKDWFKPIFPFFLTWLLIPTVDFAPPNIIKTSYAYVSVWVYVYVYLCTCVCVCVGMYVYMCVYVCVCIYIHTYILTYACECVRVYKGICVYTYVRVCF